MSSQLQQIKAKALAEKRKKQVPVNENVESCFFRQLKESSLHPRIIKQARKSGILNLSNRNIAEVPDVVWNLNSLSAEETKALSLSLESSEEDRWWEYVDLTKIILASNTIKVISSEISNYLSLTVLDLHDNCISSLPSSLSKLRNLSKLNLSRNEFEELPDCIFQLTSLKSLFVQHNKLSTLSDDISNLSFLEELDLSDNQLKKLPHCIGFLSRVTNLNLSKNVLVSLPVEIGDLTALKHFDVSNNKLKALPDSLEMLHHLEQLYIQHNCITLIPPLSSCVSLKEIHSGYNNINELPHEFIESISGVKILDLRDNKLAEIPDNIYILQALERLDLTNNSLSSLPYTLGTLPHLKFLAIEGNPMRSIRRDIIQRGTVQLLRWLRSRIEDPSTLNMSCLSLQGCDSSRNISSACSVDKYSLKSSKTLNMSNKNLNTIPLEMIQTSSEAGVTIIDFSKNCIADISDHLQMVLPNVTELNLGYNKLNTLPEFISVASNLQFLDLRNNFLQSLPMGISQLTCLREINISFNRFQSLPSSLYSLKKLEIIIASDNKIEDIEVSGLSTLPALAVLDLHNNNIKTVPPELGNMTQLRSLLLDGNVFRNPRPAILSKGTPTLLEFLRSRIPQS